MDVKTFFDNLAPVWDNRETCTEQQLRPFVERCGAKHGDKVLDLGCGTGIVSGILRDMGCLVTAMDISDRMIDIARAKYGPNSGIRFVCQDFYTCNEGKFDCVVVFNAYPHFTDRSAFADKLYNVLNDGGRFAVMHNIGRTTLAAHHSGTGNISVEPLPIQNEMLYFTDKFDIVCAEDDDVHYLLKGIRK